MELKQTSPYLSPCLLSLSHHSQANWIIQTHETHSWHHGRMYWSRRGEGWLIQSRHLVVSNASCSVFFLPQHYGQLLKETSVGVRQYSLLINILMLSYLMCKCSLRPPGHHQCFSSNTLRPKHNYNNIYNFGNINIGFSFLQEPCQTHASLLWMLHDPFVFFILSLVISP